MTKNLIKKSAIIISGASMLAGCAATKKASDYFDETNDASKGGFEKAKTVNTAASTATGNPNKSSNFGRTDKTWVNPIPLPKQESKEVLPSVFHKNVAMTMPGTINIVEILSEMQRSTGIKFKLMPDVYDSTPSNGKLFTSQSATGAGGSAIAQKQPILVPDFVYKGSLEDGLNLLSSKANVSWKWNGSEVEIFRYETKLYSISSMAGAMTSNSSVSLTGNQGDSGGTKTAGTAGSQGTASVQRSSSVKQWDEFVGLIATQMTSSGQLAVLESAGAVSVKDTPAVHKRIEKAVKEINDTLTKQVYINVDIYAVRTSEADNFSFNPSLLFKGSTWIDLATGTNNIALGVTSQYADFNAGIIKGPWAGSRFILQALSTMGDTSLLNQFTVTTLNGQPAPISSSTSQAYIKQTEQNTTGVSPSVTTYTVDVDNVIEGVNMAVTPKVEKNGNMLLEYSLNINEVICVNKKACEGSVGDAASKVAVSLPITSGKSFLQRAQMRSGQTLLVSGFKQKVSSIDRSGVGTPYNPVLGGSDNSMAQVQYLVVAITPYIANNNNPN